MKHLVMLLFRVEYFYRHNIPFFYASLFTLMVLASGGLLAAVFGLSSPWAQFFIIAWFGVVLLRIKPLLDRFYRWRSTWHVFHDNPPK